MNIFRRFYGIINFILVIRYFSNGWIESYFKDPILHFHHFGMEWIHPLPYEGMLLLFILMGCLSLLIAFDIFAKFSVIIYTICFSYFHFSDATIYLNHYYLISVIGFLLSFLPNQLSSKHRIPFYYVFFFRIQIGLVYFFGGLAKINSDWILEALPLSLWLQQVEGKIGMPSIEYILLLPLTAYLFSWFGLVFDLLIPFLLAFSKTKKIYFYFLIILFHSLTSILFPIGIFPLLMILLSTIYFSPNWPNNFIKGLKLSNIFQDRKKNFHLLIFIEKIQNSKFYKSIYFKDSKFYFLLIFITIQILIPLRSFAYSGSTLWTEDGIKFSWRVMVAEKVGDIEFTLSGIDPEHSNKITQITINPQLYLTPYQYRMMAISPEQIVQFAKFLENKYHNESWVEIKIFAKSRVSLNGSKAKPLISRELDLTQININHIPFLKSPKDKNFETANY